VSADIFKVVLRLQLEVLERTWEFPPPSHNLCDEGRKIRPANNNYVLYRFSSFRDFHRFRRQFCQWCQRFAPSRYL